MIKLSIVIPVFNEPESIPISVKFLQSLIDVPLEIIFVVDSPQDLSVPVIKNEENCFLVINNYGKGAGNAIRAGVEASNGEYILTFAVDEILPALSIKSMIISMEKGYDLISCTRYAKGGKRYGGSIIGGLLSKIGNRLFSIISNSQLTDSTTGIKMFRRSIFKSFTYESKQVGWVILFEFALKAEKAGFKVGEVPIVSVDRLTGGTSTFRVSWLREYSRWAWWGISHKKLK